MPSPKPPVQITLRPSVFKLLRRICLVLLLLVVVVVSGAIGYRTYHTHQIATDKARFVQAEKDVDEVSKAIVAATGQPAKTESKKYCSRPSRKFDDGVLSCNIIKIMYFTSMEDRKVFDAVNTSKVVHATKPIRYEDLIASTYTLNNVNQYNQTFATNSVNFICHMNYIKYDAQNTPSGLSALSNEKNILTVIFGCSDTAKAEYYPISS